MIAQAVEIDYTNWRGERSIRRILPTELRWDCNQWHSDMQWMLEAIDLDKDETRTFAMKDIHSWKPLCSEKSSQGDKPAQTSLDSVRQKL